MPDGKPDEGPIERFGETASGISDLSVEGACLSFRQAGPDQPVDEPPQVLVFLERKSKRLRRSVLAPDVVTIRFESGTGLRKATQMRIGHRKGHP